MIAIRPCPAIDVPGQLVFLAHSDETESAFRRWSDHIEVPARTVVLRIDGDPRKAALAVRQLPLVVPTMHLCAGDVVGAAVELARDARAAPDLILIVDTGGAAAGIRAAVARPPVPVPLTVLTVRGGDGSCAARTASWGELTSRTVSFRLLPGCHGGLLTADSPVPGLLVSLIGDMVNNSPIEVET